MMRVQVPVKPAYETDDTIVWLTGPLRFPLDIEYEHAGDRLVVDQNVWVVLMYRDLRAWVGDGDETLRAGIHLADVVIVSPDALRESLKVGRGPYNSMYEILAVHGYDYNDEARARLDQLDDEAISILLAESGHGATLYQEQGSNKNLLLRTARLFIRELGDRGCYQDRMSVVLNLVGSTGWDFLVADIIGPLQGRGWEDALCLKEEGSK